MYVPPMYRASGPEQTWEVVRTNPLAVLISNGPREPYATHLPLVPRDDESGDLVGAILWGHLNRANPHWAALADAQAATPAKAIFSGPGSYVSPADYPPGPAAPTWDFVSVHLTGELTVLPAGDESLAVVRRTVDLLEGGFGRGWDQSGSTDYFRSIVRGVGAFAFRVVAAETMLKLSQEKPVAVRQRIIDRFAADGPCTRSSELGRMMADEGLGVPR
jgi:transcriptional regulator